MKAEVPGAHESHHVALHGPIAFLCPSRLSKPHTAPTQSCGFSREDRELPGTVPSTGDQGLISQKGCGGRLEDVCSPPVPLTIEAALLRKKSESSGEFHVHFQGNIRPHGEVSKSLFC